MGHGKGLGYLEYETCLKISNNPFYSMSTADITAQNITGTWRGEFVYGPMYPEPVRNTATSFTMQLIAYEHELTGICKDDDLTALAEGTITIKGTLTGNNISFQKQYPYTVLFTKEGKVHVHFVRRQRPVAYTGSYDAGTGAFSGSWEFTAVVYRRIPIIGVFFPPRRYRLGGTWTMKKA